MRLSNLGSLRKGKDCPVGLPNSVGAKLRVSNLGSPRKGKDCRVVVRPREGPNMIIDNLRPPPGRAVYRDVAAP